MAILGRSIPNHTIIGQGADSGAGPSTLVISGQADNRYFRSRRGVVTSVPRSARIALSPNPTVFVVQAAVTTADRHYRSKRPIVTSVPRFARTAITGNPTLLVLPPPPRKLPTPPPIIWVPPPVAPVVVADPTPGAVVVMPPRPLPRPGAPIIGRTGEGAAPVPPTPQDVDFCAFPPFTVWRATVPETNWTGGHPLTNWRADPPEEC